MLDVIQEWRSQLKPSTVDDGLFLHIDLKHRGKHQMVSFPGVPSNGSSFPSGAGRASVSINSGSGVECNLRHCRNTVLSIAGTGLQNKSRVVQDSALLIALQPALPLAHTHSSTHVTLLIPFSATHNAFAPTVFHCFIMTHFKMFIDPGLHPNLGLQLARQVDEAGN